MKYFVKVDIIGGLRMLAGCTTDRAYAERHWGLGAYGAVHADNSHQVRRESIRQGITDEMPAGFEP